ncbi:hypothetical protein [Shewanella colwelliana]
MVVIITIANNCWGDSVVSGNNGRWACYADSEKLALSMEYIS